MRFLASMSRRCACERVAAPVNHYGAGVLTIGVRLDVKIKTKLGLSRAYPSGAGRCPWWQRSALLVLCCLGLAGCESEGGRVRAPSTEVNVIHVARNFGSLEFRRVERLEGTLSYRSSSVFNWDSGPYTFNIDTQLPNAQAPIRLYSFDAELTAGNDYSILLTEANGWIRELVLEAPENELSGTEAEILVAHAAGAVGPVDVYLEPPGAVLAAAMPRGSLSFLESIPVAGITPGEYEVSLTQVNNPSSLLMLSNAFEIAAGVRTTLTVTNGINQSSPAAVLASGAGLDTPLTDRELRASLRALNAMTSGDAIDVTVNSIFSPPLIPGVEVGAPSDYSHVAPGSHTLMVTPAGNPGVIETEQTFLALPGQRGTWFIRGDPGALSATYAPDNQRLIRDVADLSVYFGGTTVSSVDVYVAPPDTDLSTVAPAARLSDSTPVSRLLIGLRDYAITIRDSGTENVLAGPIDVAIDFEGNYGILITNGASGSGVDVTLFDRFVAE